MKRALKINLSGQIFHIDEDAYEKLKIYLDTISSHFSNIEESKEILDDIEARIAEIFSGKKSFDSKVINIDDVNEVINILGRPEEIIDEEEPEQKTNLGSTRHSRRLYRDPDNAVIGGVAAGLSAYFNIDLLALRILFVVILLLGGGTPFFIYLVLWIAVPKATTAAEKLEMRGEKVTVSNLEKKIHEEYEGVRVNFNRARNSDAGKRTENFFYEFFRVLGVIIVGLLKVIIAIVAFAFVVAGLSIIVSAIGFAFFGAHFVPFGIFHSYDLNFNELLAPFFNPVNIGFVLVSGILVLLIPILAIIYGLFKALFRFKAKDSFLGISAFALWVLALIVLVTMIVVEGRNFSEGDSVSNNVTIEKFEGDTLYLRMDKSEISKLNNREKFHFDDRQYFFEDDEFLYGQVEVDIEKSRSSDFEIRIRKGSRGSDEEEALELAGNIQYDYQLNDSVIELDPYFRTDLDKKWRLQTLKIYIYVPENKAVHLDQNTSSYLQGIYNLDHYNSYRMAGKTWVMREEGLEYVKKNQTEEDNSENN